MNDKELQEIKDGIKEDVHTEIDASIGKWTKRNIYAFITLVILVAGAWFQLTFQVQANTSQLNQGGRYTSKDGDLLELKVDHNTENITRISEETKEDIREIKSLLEDIRKAI